MATKIILSAQTVVVLVRSYGDFLKKRYGHKGVQYIPHGASVEAHLKAETNEKIILIFGHMGPHKGLPLMFEAFKKLTKEKSNIKLVVAGSNHPNFPNYLEEFVKAHIPNVEFLGYVPRISFSQFLKWQMLLFYHIMLRPEQAAYFIYLVAMDAQL